MEKYRFSKHFDIIMRKQFEMVNADFDSFDFDQPDWYTVYEWSKENEDKFSKWLMNYLKNNKKEIQKEFDMFLGNSHAVEKAIELWILNYGWHRND